MEGGVVDAGAGNGWDGVEMCWILEGVDTSHGSPKGGGGIGLGRE